MLKRKNSSLDNKNYCDNKGRSERIHAFILVCLCLLALTVYWFISRVFDSVYMIKSVSKITLFLLVPVIFGLIPGVKSVKDNLLILAAVLRPGLNFRRQAGVVLIVGVSVVIAANLLARPLAIIFKINEILWEINERTKASALAVLAGLIYIPTINAMVEELFFRGFLLRALSARISFRIATILSALLFALYHLAVFRSWFSLSGTLIAVAGLSAAALLLNHISRQDGHIWRAWLLHAFANIAVFAISFQFFIA